MVTSSLAALGIVGSSVGYLAAVGVPCLLIFMKLWESETLEALGIYSKPEATDKTIGVQSLDKLEALVEEHPEYLHQKLTDFENLDEFLNDNNESTALVATESTEEAAKKIELALDEKKLPSMHEPAIKLHEIFTNRKQTA